MRYLHSTQRMSLHQITSRLKSRRKFTYPIRTIRALTTSVRSSVLQERLSKSLRRKANAKSALEEREASQKYTILTSERTSLFTFFWQLKKMMISIKVPQWSKLSWTKLTKQKNFKLLSSIILVECAKLGVNHAVNRDINFTSVLKNFSKIMQTSGAKFATQDHTRRMTAPRSQSNGSPTARSI